MVNPQLLRIAREARGLTQTEVADKTGLPQADVSRWERGLRTPSPEQVERLGEFLGLPPSFLVEDIRLTQPVHRTARIQSKRTERTVDARLELARIAASKLLRDIDVNVPFAFPTAGEPAPPDPESAADALRRVWRVPDGPIDDLTAHLEAAGAIVLRVDFGTDEILAAYSHPRGDHRWCFVNTRALDGARARFSLAHELGHAVLHWDRFDMPTGKDAEREAHRFAAAFLMPRQEMLLTLGRRRITLDELIAIRQGWKVSIQALITRAGDLGLITASQKTRLWKQLSARGWRRSEPGDVQPEDPQTFREALAIHRNDHEYSEEEISELAGLPLLRLHDLMPDYFIAPGGNRPRLSVVR